jgi:predicted enzyme related to lactoylglutathione lyase
VTLGGNQSLPRLCAEFSRSPATRSNTLEWIFQETAAAPVTVAAIKTAGGTMMCDPRPFGNTGTILGFAIDPAGNRIELIQRP